MVWEADARNMVDAGWPCRARKAGLTPPGTDCQPCRKRIFTVELYWTATWTNLIVQPSHTEANRVLSGWIVSRPCQFAWADGTL